MLEVVDLYFSQNRRNILKGISFKAINGEITTLLGPNGSGKTTIFKCISGIWKPAEGKIIWNGKRMDKSSLRERAKVFSFVPQEHKPPFSYNVLDVVITGRASHIGRFSLPSERDYEIAKGVMKMVGIWRLWDRPYTKISGGERQLVLIARALAQCCPVMLLDEPISHLDFKNQIRVLRLVKRLSREKGLSIVMSLHDPNLAIIFSDRVVMIKDGIKVKEGDPEDVITEELIKKIYGIDAMILSLNGKKAIIPLEEKKNVFGYNLAKLL